MVASAPRSFFESLHREVDIEAESTSVGHTVGFVRHMISVLTAAG
jgi:hypothetical protein